MYLAVGSWQGSKAVEQSAMQALDPKTNSIHLTFHGSIYTQKDRLIIDIARSQLGSHGYPWLIDLFPDGPLIVASFAMATLGGIGNVLRQLAVEHRPFADTDCVVGPIFSGLIGAMLYMFLTLLPSSMYVQNSIIRTNSVMSLSFFGGLFATDVFTIIEKRMKRHFVSGDLLEDSKSQIE